MSLELWYFSLFEYGYGMNKIAVEYLVRIICMVIICVIALELEQECDHPYFRVEYDHALSYFVLVTTRTMKGMVCDKRVWHCCV